MKCPWCDAEVDFSGDALTFFKCGSFIGNSGMVEGYKCIERQRDMLERRVEALLEAGDAMAVCSENEANVDRWLKAKVAR